MKFELTYRPYFLISTVLLGFLIFSCGTKKNKTIASEAQSEKLNQRRIESEELEYKDMFYEALRLRTVGDIDGSIAQLESCLAIRPNDDAVLFLLAEHAENGRKLNKSLGYIKRASSIDPNNIWYTELLARLQLNTGDYLGAEGSYEKLVIHDQYNHEWSFFYSETLIFNEKYDKAIGVLSDLIAKIGPMPELVAQRNALFIELEKDEEMLTSLEDLIVRYPDSPEFASMLVSYYLEQKMIDEAEVVIDRLMEAHPENPGLNIAKADILRAKGDKTQAYAQLKKAVQGNSLDLDNSIEMLLSILEKERKIDDELLEIVLILRKNNPDKFMVHAILGDVYKRKGSNLLAIDAFETALEIEKSSYHLWQEVVSLNYLSHRYATALSNAENALELYPSQPEIYYYAGMSAMKLDKFNEAMDYFDMGVELVIRDKSMLALFELAKAEVYLKQNKLSSARRHIDNADNLAWNDQLMLNNKAFLLATYKIDLDLALLSIQKARIGNERDPLFLDTEAWVYLAMKDYQKAIEIIEKAYEIAPHSHEINEHYGDILYHLGRIDEAVSFWKKSQELGNLNPELSNKIKNRRF
jgi:tetratricopeptide (TPR) repeat protein